MEQSLTIYKASAGSGKTFALVVEYIKELLQPHAEKEFEHTLAVTFTNKATAEMKSRILETLYGLKMGLEESKPYLESLQAPSPDPSPEGERLSRRSSPLLGEGLGERPWETQEVAVQAGKALTAILHDYSHFRVETIDSFFQSILRNMARELGLAANLQVELSHDEVIESAVDSLIDTMDERPDVKDWVLSYIREQLDSGDKWDIVTPLKAFAGNIFKEEYQRRSKEELARISNTQIAGAFKAQMRDIREGAKQRVGKAVDEVMDLIEDFSQISYGRNLLSFLLKAKTLEADGPTKSIEQLRFKRNNHKEAEIEEAYARLLALYPECRKDYLSATLALRHLGPLRLLEYIDERAHQIESDSGRFTLSSTPALLSKMVEGSDAPFIFEKIGTYINNVMIDEFQDTSQMQWENFKKLLFEKLASGGKGLLVGDIKQSIYRWRNGDWKILYGIESEPELKRFNIKSKPLDINYRSHQVVVSFNNMFFPIAAQKLDGIKPDAGIKLSGIYSDVKQKAKKEDGKGYVRVKLYKETDNYIQETVSDVAGQIRRLQEGGLDLSQIAILVRTNLMARQLIDGFNHYAPDIRLVSDDAFLLEAATSVQMLVAALRLLVDKDHGNGISEKYLMLHYLRDVIGKEDATIQTIALTEAEQVLPKEFTENKDDLLQLPLYLLAERLWRIFSLGNIEGEDIYALTFFDELQNHLRSAAAPDIQTFLTAWDEKLSKCSVTGSHVNGVRILTIHKAKGLAFHTVMLPFSHWDIERDRQGDVLWCSTDEAPFNELGALPISIQSRAVRTSVFAPDYEEEHLERRVDALNTLYVAFTRAIANLYVWGKTKEGTAGELIHSVLQDDEKQSPTDVNNTSEDVFCYETGSPLTEIKSEDKKNLNRLRLEHHEEDAISVKVVTRNPALYFLQSNMAQDYLNRQASDEEQEMTDIKFSGREVGKRMHDVLSRVNDVSGFDEVIMQARQEGIIGEDKDWETITRHIKEGFGNPLIASWFKPENIIYNECAIASRERETGLPQVLRPDRVVMNGSNITVIDYKFGHPRRKYFNQVREYMNLMKQMYPKHNVQGYIWYVMGERAVRVEFPSDSRTLSNSPLKGEDTSSPSTKEASPLRENNNR